LKPDAERLRRVITEFQQLIRPALDAPSEPDLIPVHGSFTPYNVRVDRDGQLWVIDWDWLAWGPPLYDELVYWISDIARRGFGAGRRGAGEVLRRMGPGAGTARLRRALVWRVGLKSREFLPPEQRIRDALFELLDRS
jgi:aminoglycoside phosphotransferase (APT) family kinase protein